MLASDNVALWAGGLVPAYGPATLALPQEKHRAGRARATASPPSAHGHGGGALRAGRSRISALRRRAWRRGPPEWPAATRSTKRSQSSLLLDEAARVLAQPGRFRGVREHARDRLSKRFHIARRNVHAGLAIDDGVGLAAGARRDDALSHRHHLQDRGDAGLIVVLQDRNDGDRGARVKLAQLEAVQLAPRNVPESSSAGRERVARSRGCPPRSARAPADRERLRRACRSRAGADRPRRSRSGSGAMSMRTEELLVGMEVDALDLLSLGTPSSIDHAAALRTSSSTRMRSIRLPTSRQLEKHPLLGGEQRVRDHRVRTAGLACAMSAARGRPMSSPVVRSASYRSPSAIRGSATAADVPATRRRARTAGSPASVRRR